MSKQGGDFDLLALVGKGEVTHAAKRGDAGELSTRCGIEYSSARASKDVLETSPVTRIEGHGNDASCARCRGDRP